VSARLVAIVGGGPVAVRKAFGVIDAGATRVRCIAPAIDQQMPAMVEQVLARYDAKHLGGAGLVFAATDNAQVNRQVVRDARSMGVLVCRADADEDEPGDFTTPAQLHKPGVIIAVSAGSAALSVVIRDALEHGFDPRWSAMALAMQTLRPRITEHPSLVAPRRSAALRDLAGTEAMGVLEGEGLEGLWQWLSRRYPELL
jgi:precorrin-2 dehydrogenase/sirohydrochlorin ferrochelatase